MIPVLKTSQEYLDYYYNKYKENFKVQRYIDFPYRWYYYGTREYDDFVKQYGVVNNRERFFDEIIVDIDSADGENITLTTKELKDIIVDRLKFLGFDFSVWSSGGRGYHINLIFPELTGYNLVDRKLLRRCFLKVIGRGYVSHSEDKAHVCLHPGVLIQLELAKHRKGGVKRLLEVVDNDKTNKLPVKVLELFRQEKIRSGDSIVLDTNRYGVDNKPLQIRYLENEDFKSLRDGRDRALFVLTAYYKQYLEGDELLTVLLDWNKYMLNNYFRKSVIRAKVRSTRKGFLKKYADDLLDELGVKL